MAIKNCPTCGSVTGNDRPVHQHMCDADPATQHTWSCDSAYCNNRMRTCVQHGGDKPRRDD